MIRDDKMMQLVAEDKEPITPFVRTVRSLYDDCGVSSVLVIGGTGDYFDVADNVLVMDSYKCIDATEKAKKIVAEAKTASGLPHIASNSVAFKRSVRTRIINGGTFAPNGKVKTMSQDSISYGETDIELGHLEQIVAKSQTIAIANALQRLPDLARKGMSLREVLREIDKRIDKDGLDCLAPGQCHGGMARPRKYEIGGAINRLRRENGIVQD
jgi:predicted ABC-class ATPase